MKILILGVTARAIAESAASSGYEIAAIDAFGDLDLQRTCECYSLRRDFHIPFSARGLVQASRELAFDALVYSANLENHPRVIARFARGSCLLGNPPEVLERVRHPPALFKSLTKAGIRTPETLYPGSAGFPDPGRRWLIKPVRGGGGNRIAFWENGRSVRRGFMLQEYLSGTACSASFVSNGREAVVIGISEQVIGRADFGARDFMYCGSFVPLTTRDGSTSEDEILGQVRVIATLLTREFGLTGVNGMDFILQDGQVCPVEVNPRYSASMELIERAYGLPVFDLHIRAVLHRALPDFDLAGERRSRSTVVSKAILYADKDGKAPETEGWIARGIRDVPHPGERLAHGKPVCTVLTAGASREECYLRLTGEVSRIKGEIYD